MHLSICPELGKSAFGYWETNVKCFVECPLDAKYSAIVLANLEIPPLNGGAGPKKAILNRFVFIIRT